MENGLSIEQVEQAISSADADEQKRLLTDLPHLLKIQVLDLAFLKVAEKSFEFWNNPEDIVYDQL